MNWGFLSPWESYQTRTSWNLMRFCFTAYGVFVRPSIILWFAFDCYACNIEYIESPFVVELWHCFHAIVYKVNQSVRVLIRPLYDARVSWVEKVRGICVCVTKRNPPGTKHVRIFCYSSFVRSWVGVSDMKYAVLPRKTPRFVFRGAVPAAIVFSSCHGKILGKLWYLGSTQQKAPRQHIDDAWEWFEGMIQAASCKYVSTKGSSSLIDYIHTHSYIYIYTHV